MLARRVPAPAQQLVRQNLLPEPLDLRSQNLRALPAVRKGRKRVSAVHRSKLRTNEDLAATLTIALQPATQHGLRKRKPLAHLLGKFATRIGDGYLRVMSVEGPKMKLLRIVQKLWPHQQPLDKVRWHKMLHYGKMREVPGDRQQPPVAC
jgi:hypothetical protein